VSPICDRPYLRLVLIGALAASLGLAACGRKGPLDPPPAASLAGNKDAGVSGTQPAIDPGGRPHAPPGPNRRIPLDALLN
jgi:predicted small lipoprotein YifL